MRLKALQLKLRDEIENETSLLNFENEMRELQNSGMGSQLTHKN